MSDRPINFRAPEVRALLDGRKSQTRRVLRPLPRRSIFFDPNTAGLAQFQEPPYAVGDRLWVREAWSGAYQFRNVPPSQRVSVATPDGPILRDDIWYWADGNPEFGDYERPRPSIHMPRWASRLTLIVTDVRVQRLQDISEADAVAEGMQPYKFPGPWWQGYRDMGDGDLVQQQYVGETPPDWMIEPRRMKDASHLDRSAVHLFATLWTSINGDDAWAANPWVAVLTFTVHRQNIDQMEPTNGN